MVMSIPRALIILITLIIIAYPPCTHGNGGLVLGVGISGGRLRRGLVS
jgi:hypothetical protein